MRFCFRDYKTTLYDILDSDSELEYITKQRNLVPRMIVKICNKPSKDRCDHYFFRTDMLVRKKSVDYLEGLGYNLFRQFEYEKTCEHFDRPIKKKGSASEIFSIVSILEDKLDIFLRPSRVNLQGTIADAIVSMGSSENFPQSLNRHFLSNQNGFERKKLPYEPLAACNSQMNIYSSNMRCHEVLPVWGSTERLPTSFDRTATYFNFSSDLFFKVANLRSLSTGKYSFMSEVLKDGNSEINSAPSWYVPNTGDIYKLTAAGDSLIVDRNVVTTSFSSTNNDYDSSSSDSFEVASAANPDSFENSSTVSLDSIEVASAASMDSFEVATAGNSDLFQVATVVSSDSFVVTSGVSSGEFEVAPAVSVDEFEVADDFNVETTDDFNVETTDDFNVETTDEGDASLAEIGIVPIASDDFNAFVSASVNVQRQELVQSQRQNDHFKSFQIEGSSKCVHSKAEDVGDQKSLQQTFAIDIEEESREITTDVEMKRLPVDLSMVWSRKYANSKCHLAFKLDDPFHYKEEYNRIRQSRLNVFDCVTKRQTHGPLNKRKVLEVVARPHYNIYPPVDEEDIKRYQIDFPNDQGTCLTGYLIFRMDTSRIHKTP